MVMIKKTKSTLPVWFLRKGMDRRFRAGHPWVYSNELTESPKGIQAGDLVELRDAAGKFLARGFGNPQSLISFRSLTRDSQWLEPDSVVSLEQILEKAKILREALGMTPFSHRLCFGESDGIPGLVIDRYRVSSGQSSAGQVFVIQAHTAGANRILPQVLEVIQKEVKQTLGPSGWAKTAVVMRNDLSVRKWEGLQEEHPRVEKEISGFDLRHSTIEVQSVVTGEKLPFEVDLLQGQKTGFFLDQFANIQLAAGRFRGLWTSKRIRILDLCSYVGQWGTQLSQVFGKSQVEVVLVDASQTALDFAKKNLEIQGVTVQGFKGDVLRDLGELPDQGFDLVISDPPALIQTRKNIPQGTHAYLQLHTQVFRLVKKGGAVVCCSCSALLEEESFAQTLFKAAQRNLRSVKWVGRGGPSADHPVLAEFPEGRYLKCWVGYVQ